MLQEQDNDTSPRCDDDVKHISPQVKIYNRNFIRRTALKELQQELHLKELDMLARKPKITPNSYKILTDRLERDIQAALAELCCDQPYIDFEMSQRVITKLNHWENIDQKAALDLQLLQTQLWLMMTNYNIDILEVDREKLAILLRLLMDPFHLSCEQIKELLQEDQNFKDIQAKRVMFLEKYPEIQDETLNIFEISQLWHKIKTEHPQFNRKQILKTPDLPSFKPEINPKSIEYANKSLQKYVSLNRLEHCNKISILLTDQQHHKEQEKIPYHNILYKRKLQKDEQLQTNRDRSTDLSIHQFATSKDIKRIVDNLYVVKPRRTDTNRSRLLEEEEFKRCTFKPETTHYKRSKSQLGVKSFEQVVERMHRGRKEKQDKQVAYQNLGRVKKVASKATEPSFLSRDIPKLILEINIDETRVEHIRLKGDEDAKIVAKKFVSKYGLNDTMLSVLEELVDEHLRSL